MKINDEGTSNAAHWHERAMKAEARLAEAERDAERYRYLFRHDDSPVARVNAIYQMWDGEDGCAGFEAVIDAIMEKK